MPLSVDQVADLLNKISITQEDSLNCDGCFEHLAEFAEAELSSHALSDVLRSVQLHILQCDCCKDEYKALLEALQALESNSGDK